MEPTFSIKEALAEAILFIRKALKKYTLFVLHLSPHQNMLQGFLLYMLIGAFLLCLPFMDNGEVSVIDNLFIAASAVSTTGLTTLDFSSSYSFAGKLIVLMLIQIGGIGYMTMSSFLYLSFSHRLRHRHMELLNAEFVLPKSVRVQDFLRAVIIFTFLAEMIGTGFLYNYFIRHDFTPFDAMWYAVFHSVSAFCTAGFSLFPDSMMSFADSKTINIVISSLALAGSMGFIVVTDLFNRIVGRTREISYTSKIITLFSLLAILLCSFFLLITNPGLHPSAAVFQSIAAMSTSGFNTVSIPSLTVSSFLVLIVMMSVGGSPSGTAGGLKSTTVTCLIATVSSHLFGRKHITFLGRQIPLYRLYIANSTFIFYTFMLWVTVFLLTWVEDLPFLNLLFDAASALSTAGLSSGTTGQLGILGKLILIAAMIIGRVGVITFGMALLKRDEDELEKEEEEPVKREDLAV